MRRLSALFAAALVPGALAFAVTPAAHVPEGCGLIDDAGTADVVEDDVIGCEATVYYDCSTAHGGKVHVPSSLGTGVDLVAEAPTASFTEGAGCGQQETAQATGSATTSIYDLNATGFLAGNVDTLTVELHSIYAGSLRAGGEVTLDVRLVVSGESPAGFRETPATGTGDPIGSPESFQLEVPLVVSDTGLSESMTFTVTDLYAAFPELSGAGTGDETFQSLDVTVGVVESDWAGVFVWGATEVPANVTINSTGDLGTTVSALDLGAGA